MGIPEFDSLPETDIAWLKKRDYRRTQPPPIAMPDVQRSVADIMSFWDSGY